MDEHLSTEEWLGEIAKVYDYKLIGDYHYIGKHDVIFGTRIRAGRLYDFGCELDLCFGTFTSIDAIIGCYSLKMEQNISDDKSVFNDLMLGSEIKPCVNDDEWCDWFKHFLTDLVKWKRETT